jgi:catechol 2,3-dioxygenase-like lactoylglutathione lyase family enzyme
VIERLSHLTFIVRNLDRMTEILEAVLDAREVYASGDDQFSLSREKFFLIGEVWIVIMEGEPLPSRSYNHIAFKIDEGDVDRYLRQVEKLGLELRPPRPRVEGEGRSIYFYDHDNHLFELHTGTLSDRLDRYMKKSGAAS